MSDGTVSDPRPYAALLAKGEDRRLQILAAAQRLLTRNGMRGTTLGQIAKEAGVTSAGLLHHFDSKEQLVHAALDARDAFDDANSDRAGDIRDQLEGVARRFRDAPELIGLFTVLLGENLDSEAPMHPRFLKRYRTAIETVADSIRRGQATGRYRTDLDPEVKAVEVVAFLQGIETSWLLDPTIPLTEVFGEYIASLTGVLAAEPS
ncbi:TetR/AcrR family transcriptional regulator [Actinocorallia longicatena]|uniref:TetR/AcrR family transcriptional regulator n=1 Tax=Actinocorallia longicatena TaxID=111803 RepID=A0ABP6Q8L6_9ACTN